MLRHSVKPINQLLHTAHCHNTIRRSTEPLSNLDGSLVARQDQANQVSPTEPLKRVIRSCSRTLGRQAPAPDLPRKRPAQFVVGPALWVVQPNSPNETPTRTLFGGPHPE